VHIILKYKLGEQHDQCSAGITIMLCEIYSQPFVIVNSWEAVKINTSGYSQMEFGNLVLNIYKHATWLLY
jgi:hypothetical protein